MPEPTLEFIGQRLKAVQDEQHSMRSDIRTITLRLDTMTDRIDRIVDRMDMMLQLSETRFAAIEGKLDLIIEKLER